MRYFALLLALLAGCSRPPAAAPATAPATQAATRNAALSETRKIERLIESVSALPGATFIRNGAEHTAAEAAAHMRSKLGKAGDQVTTARQFIDEIASKSSISGKPYQIRLADGRTVAAGEFLHEQLRKIEQDR